MRKEFVVAAKTTLILVVFSLGAASPSFANDTQDETVERLVSLNPGISAEQLFAEAEELAVEFGTTPQAILEQQLAEAEESVAAVADDGLDMSPNSGGGKGRFLGSTH